MRFGSKASREQNSRLDEIIYERLVKSADQSSDLESYFVPNDQLENIITLANVEKELDHPENKSLLTDIWNRSTRRRNIERSNSGLTNLICYAKPPIRKIFAILCLMRKAYAIWWFLEEHVTDHDLPFVFVGLHGDVLKTCKDTNHKNLSVEIKLFGDKFWIPHRRDSFKVLQWRFLAPYFPLSYELKQKSRHKDLGPSTILPVRLYD